MVTKHLPIEAERKKEWMEKVSICTISSGDHASQETSE